MAYTAVPCIANINGSHVEGGCPCALMTTKCQCSDGNTSGFHIDGIVPDINTSKTGSWANQLFDICSTNKMIFIGFQFHEPVQITSVELNLFICYQWNIPERQFNVTISTSTSLMLPIGEIILGNLVVDMNQSNCNGLIRFVIYLNNYNSSSQYILKFISLAKVQLYIGEIMFRNQTPVYSCKLITNFLITMKKKILIVIYFVQNSV